VISQAGHIGRVLFQHAVGQQHKHKVRVGLEINLGLEIELLAKRFGLVHSERGREAHALKVQSVLNENLQVNQYGEEKGFVPLATGDCDTTNLLPHTFGTLAISDRQTGTASIDD
jgi:hypothetical protein